MDCCAHRRGLNGVFDDRLARDEMDRYWKRGLDRHARALADLVAGPELAGAQLLEVGGGIGGLHADLLQRGAARAVNVDLSSAYLEAAQQVAGRLGLRERVDYHLADFAREAGGVPAADVVLMHRVVCCYPDMLGLMQAAGQRAGRLLALSFPDVPEPLRPLEKLVHLVMAGVLRTEFRIFFHSRAGILRAAADQGLQVRRERVSWPWRLVVFERVP